MQPGPAPLEVEAAQGGTSASEARRRSSRIVQVLSSGHHHHDADSVGLEATLAGTDAGGTTRRRTVKDVVEGGHKTIEGLKRKTLLAPAVVEALQDQEPETLSWLQTAAGLLLQVGLLAFYVMIDTAKGLTSKLAVQDGKVQASALVLLNTAASIVIGFGMTVKFEGLAKAKAALVDLEAMRKYGFVAALFTISTILNIMAYGTSLDAGTVKILGQFRLPFSAFLSRLILGRKYSFNHWMILVIITITALAFFLGTEEREKMTKLNVKGMTPEECFLNYDPRAAAGGKAGGCKVAGSPPPGPGSAELGMLYLGAWIVIVVSASLTTERFFKAASKTPFYVQKMQMEMSGVWVSIVSAFLVPAVIEGAAWDPNKAKKMWWQTTTLDCEGGGSAQVGGHGLFEGFGWSAFLQLFVAILQGWLGGIVVKKFSTVVKNIAKSLSLVLTVFSNELLLGDCWDEPLSPIMYLLSFSIFCSTMVFSQLGEDGEKRSTPAAGPPALQQPPALPPVSASEHRRRRSSASADYEQPGGGGWKAAAAAEEEMEKAMGPPEARGLQDAATAPAKPYQSGLLRSAATEGT